MAGLWVMLAGPHDDRNHFMHISLCGLSLVRPLPSDIPSISSREAGYELAIRGAGATVCQSERLECERNFGRVLSASAMIRPNLENRQLSSQLTEYLSRK